MRKHFRASRSRARAARSCLGAVAGSVVIVGLTACGGGGDTAPTEDPTQVESLTDSPASPQKISTPALGMLVKDTGWSAALPTLPPRTFEKPSVIAGKTYYIDFTRSYHSTQELLPGEDGLTPQTAFTNLGQFKKHVIANTEASKRLQRYDAILLKCGATFRSETLSLNGVEDLYIGPYQPGQTGPRDCADDKLPTLRQSKYGGNLGWTATDSSNTVYAASVPTTIARLFSDKIPLVKARHPNTNAANKYLLASPVSPNTPSNTQFKVSAADKSQFDAIAVSSGIQAKDVLEGADILIRAIGWQIERRTIQTYDPSTGVITINRAVPAPIKQGSGYSLAGKAWMFDQPGEWYQSGNQVRYRPQRAQAQIPNELSGLEYTDSATVNSVNVGLSIKDSNNVTISRIAFDHHEYAGLVFQSTDTLLLHGVEVRFASEIGISVARNGLGPKKSPSTNVLVEFCKIRGSRGYGINAGGYFGTPRQAHTQKVLLRNNLITETGMHEAAVKQAQAEATDMTAIRIGAPEIDQDINPKPTKADLDAQALGNIVINSGGRGIQLDNGRHGGVIDSNVVINTCLRTSDCGAIYTQYEDQTKTHPAAKGTTSARISNNIISGVTGDAEGLPTALLAIRPAKESTYGIYLDDLSANIEVTNNLVTHAAGGIYLHNTSWNDVHHNTIKAVTLASIEVSSDWDTPGAFTDTVRGNVIRDNTLFSHRTVDFSKVESGASLQEGIEASPGRGSHVYAQFWLHKTDPSAFFTGEHPNVSFNNVTKTLSSIGETSTWRMGANAQARQTSGGIWALLQPGGAWHEMPLRSWLKRVPTTQSAPDMEEGSPISYRPYVLTLGNSGKSLVADLARGSAWVWNLASQVPYFDGSATCGGAAVCAGVTASAYWHALMSPYFASSPGQLYFAAYTIKQGPVRGEHSMSPMRRLNDNNFAPIGEYVQSVYTEANEIRHFEHFFRANSNAGVDTLITLKPSDGILNSPKPYTTQYFSNVTIHPVTAWEVLPPLDQFSVTAVNASSNARSFSCTDLGLSTEQCNSLRDESNQPVGPSVQVDARTMKRLYVHLPTFSN